MRSASDCESTEANCSVALDLSASPYSEAGSRATLTPSGMLTRNGWAGSLVWRAAGYWRTAKDSTVAGGGRRMVSARFSGRMS